LVQIAGVWVCADCKPAFLSRVMASGAAGASPLALRYGGFWIRFCARFIDGLIFMVPILIFAACSYQIYPRGGQAGNPASAPARRLQLRLYHFLSGFSSREVATRFDAEKYRSATLGKMACGLGHPIRRPR
jgi:uncharacterized RDD family membrane protein YckC